MHRPEDRTCQNIHDGRLPNGRFPSWVWRDRERPNLRGMVGWHCWLPCTSKWTPISYSLLTEPFLIWRFQMVLNFCQKYVYLARISVICSLCQTCVSAEVGDLYAVSITLCRFALKRLHLIPCLVLLICSTPSVKITFLSLVGSHIPNEEKAFWRGLASSNSKWRNSGIRQMSGIVDNVSMILVWPQRISVLQL